MCQWHSLQVICSLSLGFRKVQFIRPSAKHITVVLLSPGVKMSGWLCKYSSTNSNHLDQVKNWCISYWQVGMVGMVHELEEWGRPVLIHSAPVQSFWHSRPPFRSHHRIWQRMWFVCFSVTMQILKYFLYAWIFMGVESVKSLLRMNCSGKWSSLSHPLKNLDEMFLYWTSWTHELIDWLWLYCRERLSIFS